MSGFGTSRARNGHFRGRSILSLMTLAFALAPFVAPSPILAQSATRPSASPVTPGEPGRPTFDTQSATYQGTTEGSRAAATVVAEVDGRAITLADVGERIRSVPQNIANLPFEILFPNMVEQLVRREALVLRAQRRTYDEDPVVRRRMKAAADEVLANETIIRETAPTITDAAMQERYRRDYAGKPGPEEALIRVIGVPTEAEAASIIRRLAEGADFATLARTLSKDTTASEGGTLGYMTRDALNPEIGAVAFVLAPGQVAAYPVRSAGTWFVVKTEVRRQRPTPTYAMVREVIRQALIREAAFPAIRSALADVTVREYDVAGKETDTERPEAR